MFTITGKKQRTAAIAIFENGLSSPNQLFVIGANAMTHEEPRFFELVTAVREALAAGHGRHGTRDAAGTTEER